MKLSAADTICNRSIKHEEQARIERERAEYEANGGQIHQSEAGRVRYVPQPFTIKQR